LRPRHLVGMNGAEMQWRCSNGRCRCAKGVLGPDGLYRHLSPDGQEATDQLIPARPWAVPGRELIIPLVSWLVTHGQQVIVFRSTRGAARGCAGYLAGELHFAAAGEALNALPAGDPSTVSAQLRRCLTGGLPSISPTSTATKSSPSRNSSAAKTARSG
jgi:hypothetical protein